MRNKLRFFLLLIVCATMVAALPVGQVMAQDEERSLEETLQMLSEDAAKKYINPISSAFGANLNGAWFHRAPKPKKVGFDFEFGFVAMGSFFPDDATSFETTGEFRFSTNEANQLVAGQDDQVKPYLVEQITSKTYTVGISGATVIGASDDYIKINFPGDQFTKDGQTFIVASQDIRTPVAGYGDLAESNVLPLAAPQLSIGTIFGTQATFRYLPDTELNDDLGTLKYFGFGIQHNPEIFFPNFLPVNVAASFFTQKLEVGDMFKTTTTAFGINVSRQFGPGIVNVTPYAGFMLESAKMEVTYDYIVDTPTGQYTQQINFELEGENKSRFTLGLNIKLLIFNINADYNFGKYNSATAGVFFAI